ncbi:DUF3263 domain-containing protein [Streptomyces sp.]|uniref:DUF3263 domain-containing protein n=1 Tax=Streptomyces sp. TaxID=1931 RepID=UPI002F3EFAA1
MGEADEGSAGASKAPARSGAPRSGASGPSEASGPSGPSGPSGAEAAEGQGDSGGLSERDLAVLDIAGRTFSGPGPRERAIRERLGISPTAYFQRLNALLDDPRALRHAPVTVNRLRRERERHRGER